MIYSIYLVRCSDNSLYCGISNNVARRVYRHNFCKSGARYTKYRRPVILVYEEKVGSRSDALRREYQVKRLTKTQKEKLIRGHKSD